MGLDEQYKMFFDHVSKLTERRGSVSTIYLSVNAAITAVIAFIFKDVQLSGVIAQISVLTLLISGLVASSIWRRLIKQYSSLIGWWYERLRNLECAMSLSNKLLTDEYHRWYSSDEGQGSLGLTRYETALTWLFTTVYFLFGLGSLIAIISKLL
jgi:hypothetical protein